MKKIFILTILAVFLSSCSIGFRIYVVNHTKANVYIELNSHS